MFPTDTCHWRDECCIEALILSFHASNGCLGVWLT